MRAATKSFELTREYDRALKDYCVNGGEDLRSRAYEIGRLALGNGYQLLDLSDAHHRAVESIVEQVDAEALSRCAEFFAEALSPFEMAYLGFREANDQLLEINTTLKQRNAELSEAKTALESMARELEAFSYSISHDLRAPLRRIVSYCEIIREDIDRGTFGEDDTAHFERIRSQAEEMQGLIDALLRLAAITQADFQRREIDLTRLVSEVADEVAESEPERDIDITIHTVPPVEGDRDLLRAAVMNLLENAWKFTEGAPDATIEFGSSVDERGERVFFIRDSGAGFDPAYADKLFDPFQRLHSSEEFEGTGVGLATVKRIVKRHGGAVWAEGDVDKGATFFFTLASGEEDD